MSVHAAVGSAAGRKRASLAVWLPIFEQDVLQVARLAGADVEALVGFLKDQRVGGLRRAEGVAVEPVMALGLFVFDRVEEGGIVIGPHDGTDALGGVGEGLTGAQVLDVQRVLAEAGVVDGVGEQVLIVGDGEGAESHEGLADGKLVAVENDLLGCVQGVESPLRRQWMAYCEPSTVRE